MTSLIKKFIIFLYLCAFLIFMCYVFPCSKQKISYTQPTTNVSNEKPTLTEFLSHAIEPLGTTLYIFGGGWAYDKEEGDEHSRNFGVAPSWKEFFDSQNEWFVYKNSKKKETSYFPFNGYNKHHEKGLDCTGYLGWLFYNTFETEDTNKNYVYTSSKWLDTYVNTLKLGTKEIPNGNASAIAKSIKSGDVITINGHAYIVIGKCDDESIVIIHSSVSNSVTGAYGGGLQLSAINVNNSENKNCEAYELADFYMSTYFPEWHKRYPTVVKPTWKYLNFKDKYNRYGIFHFDENIINDPDDLKNKTADEILKILFE